MLYRTTIRDGQLYLCLWPPAQGPSAQVSRSLLELVQSIEPDDGWSPCSCFAGIVSLVSSIVYLYVSGALLLTYERQLDLLCHMCLDRQYIAINAFSALLPVPLLLSGMREMLEFNKPQFYSDVA